MKQLMDRLFKALEIIIAGCLVVMVVLVFGNVVLRYGFNSGIAASEELSRLMFVWLIFLGAIIALRDHAHLGVDLLVIRLPPLGKKICLVLSHLLMLYGLWLLAQGSWTQTIIGLNDRAPVTGVPRAWVNVAGLVAAIAMSLILLMNLYRALIGKVSDKDLVMVKDNTELDEVDEIQEELTHPRRHK